MMAAKSVWRSFGFLLLLWIAVSIHDLPQRLCPEACSEGSCAPCDTSEKSNQSTTTLTTETDMTANSTYTESGWPPEFVSTSVTPGLVSAKAITPTSTVSSTTQTLTTAIPIRDTLQAMSVAINTHNVTKLPVPLPVPANLLQPSAFRIQVHDTMTSGIKDVPVHSTGTVLDSADPGQSGWGDFLDMLPADPNTETDSAPNHKLQLPGTTTAVENLSRQQETTSSPPLSPPRPTPSQSRTNVTDSYVLPDDSKRNQGLGPSEGGPHPHSALGERNFVEMKRQPDLGSTGVTQSGGTSEDSEGSGPNPVDTDREQPGQEDHRYPAEEEKEEEEGKAGDSGRLHGAQIVIFVAPCVGALLAVVGVVCAMRFATANCRQRHKLIKAIKKQHVEAPAPASQNTAERRERAPPS